jgi:mRNA interferase YafQ
MREIERTSRFRRDYRRESRGRHAESLDSSLAAVLVALGTDIPLADRYRDHSLTGEWAGFRDIVISGKSV